MGRCKLALGAAVALAVVMTSSCESDRPLRVGMAVPRLALDDNNGAVVWAMRPEDVLTCQDVTKALRRIERRYASDVATQVVVLGRDEGLVRGFLRSERVHGARILNVNRSRFANLFGGLPPPFLLVVVDGRVAALWSGTSSVGAAARGENPLLVDTVSKYLID